MSSSKSISKWLEHSSQLAFAAPQVIGARLMQAALAGTNPSAKDQHEFYTMGAEKVWAFYESWWAMGLEVANKNQRLMMSLFMTPWKSFDPAKLFSPENVQQHMFDVVNKGIEPVRKRAVSNAKRLNKTRTGTRTKTS